MALIDVGSAAIARDGGFAQNTIIDGNNASNRSGVIDTVKIYCTTSMTGVKIATFTPNGANSFTAVDSVLIGAVTQGAERTFSGLSLNINAGDFIGIYFPFGGTMEHGNTGGTAMYYLGGDQTTGTNTFNALASHILSLNGTGIGPGGAGILLLNRN